MAKTKADFVREVFDSMHGGGDSPFGWSVTELIKEVEVKTGATVGATTIREVKKSWTAPVVITPAEPQDPTAHPGRPDITFGFAPEELLKSYVPLHEAPGGVTTPAEPEAPMTPLGHDPKTGAPEGWTPSPYAPLYVQPDGTVTTAAADF